MLLSVHGSSTRVNRSYSAMSNLNCAMMLVFGVMATVSQAELFVVRAEFERTDESCSTFQDKDVVGVQDICQSIGDAQARGMTSPTGKAYIKRTCTTTHYFEGWYSDSGCSSALKNVMNENLIFNSTLACSESSRTGGTTRTTYTCGESYNAARWSRYEDSSCQTKDTTKSEEFYAEDFCRQSATDSFENDHKSQRYSCGSSGLERTFYKNSDCTGSSWVKTEAAVSNACTDSSYYYGHVKLDVACNGTTQAGASSTSKANAPRAIISLSLSLIINFWLPRSYV